MQKISNQDQAKEQGRRIAQQRWGETGCVRYAFAIGATTEAEAATCRRWLVGIAAGWD